jgi:uroporphyrinogen-III synthase
MNPKAKGGMTVATAMPLQGKTVLITRTKDQAEEFARLLTDRGANVVFIPTIRIASPESWEQFNNSTRIIDNYDGIIFTSSNAVRAFFQALKDRGNESVRKNLSDMVFYVVGAKTGETLVAEGFTPTLLSDVSSGRQMVKALARTEILGKRFLFPHGNLTSEDLAETLRSKGARVDEVIVYDTVALPDEDARLIRQKLREDSIDIVSFFSPSSVRNLLAAVPLELVSSKIIAVIGTSTEAAAKEAGLPVHVVPTRPTSTDLVDAIIRHIKE